MVFGSEQLASLIGFFLPSLFSVGGSFVKLSLRFLFGLAQRYSLFSLLLF